LAEKVGEQNGLFFMGQVFIIRKFGVFAWSFFVVRRFINGFFGWSKGFGGGDFVNEF